MNDTTRFVLYAIPKGGVTSDDVCSILLILIILHIYDQLVF
jgi:hypothetical protein